MSLGMIMMDKMLTEQAEAKDRTITVDIAVATQQLTASPELGEMLMSAMFGGKDRVKAMARALCAYDAEGHNDAPLFEDLSPGDREMEMQKAASILSYFDEALTLEDAAPKPIPEPSKYRPKTPEEVEATRRWLHPTENSQ